MTGNNRLKQVGEDRPAEDTPDSDPAMDLILLGIKTLSQRFVVALGQIFTLLCTASAFCLWYSVLPNPNACQLFGLGLYAGFILLLHLVIKRG